MNEKVTSNFQEWLNEIEQIKTDTCSIDNPDCEACGS